MYLDADITVGTFFKCLSGNSASKIPSLQNEYSELTENFQAYFIQKDVKFCKISALKSLRGALYEFLGGFVFLKHYLRQVSPAFHLVSKAGPSSPLRYIFLGD